MFKITDFTSVDLAVIMCTPGAGCTLRPRVSKQINSCMGLTLILTGLSQSFECVEL